MVIRAREAEHSLLDTIVANFGNLSDGNSRPKSNRNVPLVWRSLQ